MKAGYILVAALIAGVVVLIWMVFEQNATSRQQAQQLQNLTEKLSQKSAQDELALHSRCADQARKVFEQFGYRENVTPPASQEYHSHFNSKLNKCFIAIETADIPKSQSQMVKANYLYDAIERRLYASYIWVSSDTKKYWEQPPMTCSLFPAIGTEQICKSDDEYNQFVALYMDQ